MRHGVPEPVPAGKSGSPREGSGIAVWKFPRFLPRTGKRAFIFKIQELRLNLKILLRAAPGVSPSGVNESAAPASISRAFCAPTASRALSGWRQDAARLAAELLREVSPHAADEVLDLRAALLDFRTGAKTMLEVFFAARARLESEHYLLFFRLRRVLEPALGLRVSVPGREPEQRAVDFRFRDLNRLTNRVRQEVFEMDLNVKSPADVLVEPVWRLASLTENAAA